MILNLDALYEMVDMVFWSSVIGCAFFFAFIYLARIVEKWSNGGKYGN